MAWLMCASTATYKSLPLGGTAVSDWQGPRWDELTFTLAVSAARRLHKSQGSKARPSDCGPQ